MSSAEEERKSLELSQFIGLRQRMIGVKMRQARLESGLSIEDLALQTGVDAARLEGFELGQEPVPLPELEGLCGALGRPIQEFQDRHGPVGVWQTKQRVLREFQELPLELQAFVSKPTNRPYLELAMRLNEMSVERLRAVAEGLLEITY